MVVPDLPDLHPAIWPQVAEPHRPAWGPGPFPWGCAVWPACRVTLCGTAQVRVRLSEAQETLLVTLCGRAWGARARQPILGNTMAAAAIEQMDYDFRRRRSTRGWRPRSQFVPSISTTDGGVSRRARPGHRGPPGCRAGHPGLAGQPRARRDLVRRRLPRGHRAAEHVLPRTRPLPHDRILGDGAKLAGAGPRRSACPDRRRWTDDVPQARGGTRADAAAIPGTSCTGSSPSTPSTG